MAKGKKVIIEDEKKLRRAIHRDNYLIAGVLLVFIVINYDMFSAYPRLITIEDTFLKVVVVAFQVIFIISLVVWERRKKKIISILLDGKTAKGTIIDSLPIKNRGRLLHYIHTLSYKVGGKNYTVHSKSKKGAMGDLYMIVYKSNHPENSIVLEHLKKNVQRLVNY
ncbi:hypothetical protein [uncultured Dokdonia sp.]|uniref:hypothetical protein n=1 Tax=uncultured Dokdonia sp. TaxID=575653 RepID=UPI002612FB4D|nr:hypothetical protein [uncultured Dokdonia sp.]